MSSANFIVTEHTTPCQHLREFPHGSKRDDAVLQLAIKEYRPRNNLEPQEGSLTVIATHANGFPKEAYEALWDDLLKAASSEGFKIRAIWIADNAHQGTSYALNEAELGDDPNWLDHSRDLLLMVNYFRDRMVAPIVGLGHSMGCAQIIHLSCLHPRLLHSLILMEPIVQDSHPPGPNAAMFSSMRRETWPSRTQAEASISKNAFFQGMDPRVLKSYLSNALRDTEDGGVVLATPRAQEAWSYVRQNFFPLLKDTASTTAKQQERLLSPDFIPFESSSNAVFARPEATVVLDWLPHLRPHTLYLYGEYSHINYEEVCEQRLGITGTGKGGSGGAAEGAVEEKVIEDSGHLMCFEKPGVVAADTAHWLGKELQRWRKEKEFWATVDTKKSKEGKKALSDHWIRAVKQNTSLERPKGPSKL
ncbi:Alpha/beta hydrolase family-domain-containing protein [Clohesyomyces aquaticus]|uniref:Alpha/beta hydrolase family-domain-containing protein n=1 Tax=Clohesyomyces aquaticus TaxID=1231657 RepID=A0A1Y1ZJD3_9PLEO|nr:Alpha/beta hydrolase family-domain-containing protein [Clohesyomyces aquaticus]